MNTVKHQGELRVVDVARIPHDATPFNDRDKDGDFIISHSEKGHHHVLNSKHCDVLEKTDVETGMRILYAIVKEPTKLEQKASTPHDAISLVPGTYKLWPAREVDHFTGQARQVAD